MWARTDRSLQYLDDIERAFCWTRQNFLCPVSPVNPHKTITFRHSHFSPLSYLGYCEESTAWCDVMCVMWCLRYDSYVLLWEFGSESPVRAASALAICSWLGLPACGRWRWSRSRQVDVSRAGRTVSGYVGTLNFVSKSYRQPGICRSDCRGQDLRNRLCLVRVLTSQISPFKRFGPNLFKRNIWWKRPL